MGTQLYDTNILIERLRERISKLEGSTTTLNLIEFPKAAAISGLEIIVPGKDDYDKGFELAILLLKAGKPVPAVDIILAAIAINRELLLHTMDGHFKEIQKIAKNLKVKYY